jgi:hypothetical protein
MAMQYPVKTGDYVTIIATGKVGHVEEIEPSSPVPYSVRVEGNLDYYRRDDFETEDELEASREQSRKKRRKTRLL